MNLSLFVDFPRLKLIIKIAYKLGQPAKKGGKSKWDI